VHCQQGCCLQALARQSHTCSMANPRLLKGRQHYSRQRTQASQAVTGSHLKTFQLAHAGGPKLPRRSNSPKQQYDRHTTTGPHCMVPHKVSDINLQVHCHLCRSAFRHQSITPQLSEAGWSRLADTSSTTEPMAQYHQSMSPSWLQRAPLPGHQRLLVHSPLQTYAQARAQTTRGRQPHTMPQAYKPRRCCYYQLERAQLVYQHHPAAAQQQPPQTRG
jgi:hypothetical protein